MLNAANGNCLGDYIINNILGRGCYKKKFRENSKQLRVNAMFIYMADFMAQEMVPDIYIYTKLVVLTYSVNLYLYTKCFIFLYLNF